MSAAEETWRRKQEESKKKCYTSAVSSSKSTELKSYQQKSFDFRRSEAQHGPIGQGRSGSWSCQSHSSSGGANASSHVATMLDLNRKQSPVLNLDTIPM